MQLYELQHELDPVHVAFGFSVWGGGGLAAQHGDHVGDVWGQWEVQNDDQLELQAGKKTEGRLVHCYTQSGRWLGYQNPTSLQIPSKMQEQRLLLKGYLL